MGVFQLFQLLLTHPLEFATSVQFHLFHNRTSDLTNLDEFRVAGYDREEMPAFLDKTSHFSSMVIKQFGGDLARIVSFYSTRRRPGLIQFRQII
jgi:hypothetical protein